MTGTPTALTLRCTSTVSPAFTLLWRKDGEVLSNNGVYTTTQVLVDGSTSTYNNFLAVTAAPSQLSGTYSCNVRDSMDHNSASATIDIQGTI